MGGKEILCSGLPLGLVLLFEFELLCLLGQSPHIASLLRADAVVPVGLLRLALVSTGRVLDSETHAPQDVRDRFLPPDALLSFGGILILLRDDERLARLLRFLDGRLTVLVLDLERRGGQERAQELEDREVVVDCDPVQRGRLGRVLRDERRRGQSR